MGGGPQALWVLVGYKTIALDTNWKHKAPDRQKSILAWEYMGFCVGIVHGDTPLDLETWDFKSLLGRAIGWSELLFLCCLGALLSFWCLCHLVLAILKHSSLLG